MFLVLIDTSAYEDQRLTFRGPVFESLKKLSDEQKMSIIVSDIIRKEMEAHLREVIPAAVNILEKKVLSLDRLVNSDFGVVSELLENPTKFKDDIIQGRLDRIAAFFANINYEELEIKNVDLQEILDNYFYNKPPFGEGKKRKEFPDAIILNGFKYQYCETLKQTCVVSGDNDWAKYFESVPDVHFFKTIPEVIDFIHTNYDAAITNPIKQFLSENSEMIRKKILESILEDRFWVGDEWIDAEVEIDVHTFGFRNGDANILSFNHEKAVVEFTAEFDFELRVWAAVTEDMYKDYDTKEWKYIGQSQYEVSVSKMSTMTFEILYDSHPSEFYDSIYIDDITIPKDFYDIDSDEFLFKLSKHWNE